MLPTRFILRFALQSASIVVGGAVLGAGINAASSKPLALTRVIQPTADVVVCGGGDSKPHAEPARISQAEAQKACNACTAAFVDARGEAAYAQGHIMGALHLAPHEHPDEAGLIEQLRQYSMVIVYDDDVGCHLATRVASHLMDEGLKDVRVLEGSWLEWQATGGPAQSGSCEVCAHPAPASEGRTP
jgi:rhodanese-related sulfurtransferase